MRSGLGLKAKIRLCRIYIGVLVFLTRPHPQLSVSGCREQYTHAAHAKRCRNLGANSMGDHLAEASRFKVEDGAEAQTLGFGFRVQSVGLMKKGTWGVLMHEPH